MLKDASTEDKLFNRRTSINLSVISFVEGGDESSFAFSSYLVGFDGVRLVCGAFVFDSLLSVLSP